MIPQLFKSMFLGNPCRALATPYFVRALAVCALNCCTVAFLCVVISRTFSASGFLFAVCGAVAVLAAVEALHYLKLRVESFWHIVKIVDVAPVCDTFVCCVDIVQIDHNGAMFCFAGGFFVFASEGNFGDGSVFKGFAPVDNTKLLCLIFCCAVYTYVVDKFVDSL